MSSSMFVITTINNSWLGKKRVSAHVIHVPTQVMSICVTNKYFNLVVN